MRANELKLYLKQAIDRVKDEDCHLLDIDGNERSIAARLAVYLQEYFIDYQVDVEYNRDRDGVKRLRRNEGILCRVLPDVIVHRRGDDKSNLMVIEMKKKSSPPNAIKNDRQRLTEFRDQYNYKLGALVVCRTGRSPDIYIDSYYTA